MTCPGTVAIVQVEQFFPRQGEPFGMASSFDKKCLGSARLIALEVLQRFYNRAVAGFVALELPSNRPESLFKSVMAAST